MIFLSVVSGTSTDGLSLLNAEISGFNLYTKFKILNGKTIPFPKSIREELITAASDSSITASKLSELNWSLGELIIEGANRMDSDFDVIAFSGHTLYHGPSTGDNYRGTLQIGEIARLVALSGKTGISDFRTTDMAYGGLGAPLVSISDLITLKDEGTLAVNIGGISNVTFLGGDRLIAFDTGPGNMLIDQATELYFGKSMDRDAEIARKGRVITDLLNSLMHDHYFDIPLPKNTGREYYGNNYILNLKNMLSGLKPEDIIRTLTRFTAESIYNQTRRFIKYDIKKVIVGGGGTNNPVLMEDLRDLFERKILTFEDVGIPSEFREALAFAIIANQSIHQAPGRLTSIHPFSGPVLGKITPGRNFMDIIMKAKGEI